MIDFLNQVEEKIKKELSPKNISIVDNSYFHRTHKSFNENKFHLKIIIECPNLKKNE